MAFRVMQLDEEKKHREKTKCDCTVEKLLGKSRNFKFKQHPSKCHTHTNI